MIRGFNNLSVPMLCYVMMPMLWLLFLDGSNDLDKSFLINDDS